MYKDTKHYSSNAVGSVLYVPGSFVYLHWTGEALHSGELRALYVHARNLMLRYKLHLILADHRAMPAAFAPADHDWLLTDWFPHTTEEIARVRYAAQPRPAAPPARRRGGTGITPLCRNSSFRRYCHCYDMAGTGISLPKPAAFTFVCSHEFTLSPLAASPLRPGP